MPQVSKRVLSKDIEEKMFKLFFEAFAYLSNPSEIQQFFLDLLGPVERTMLAKRLAIAVLLARDYSYEDIKQTLRVSSETIARVNIALNNSEGGYKIVVNKILQDRAMTEFWEKIDDTLTSVTIPRGLEKDIHRRKWSRKPKGPLG